MKDFFNIDLQDVVASDKEGIEAVDKFTNDKVMENPTDKSLAEGEWLADSVNEEAQEVIQNTAEEYVAEVVGEDASEQQEKNEEISEEAEVAIKKIMASMGDDSYEIPAEAVVKAKVDGEEVDVSVQELLNNFSGKTAWDRKFSELDSERQNYKKDLEVVNKYMTEFANKAREDKVAAFEFLAEQVGLNPLEFRKQLRSELLQRYQSYMEMDESQRERFELSEELEYRRKMDENRVLREKEQQAEMELQRAFENTRQTNGINEERFNSLVNELNEYKVDVTPENVAKLHAQHQTLDRIDNVLEGVSKGMSGDTEKVKALYSALAANPDTTDEQLLEYAKYQWGAQKNIVGKQKQELKKQTAKKEEFKVRRPSMNSFDFF